MKDQILFSNMKANDEKDKEFEKKCHPGQVVFSVQGTEIIEKTVASCGKNGRVYLPAEWIGKKVKIVRCQKNNA